VNDTGLVGFVNMASFTPNLTFFVPNTASALATFNNVSIGLSADDLLAVFDYHIVSNFVGKLELFPYKFLTIIKGAGAKGMGAAQELISPANISMLKTSALRLGSFSRHMTFLFSNKFIGYTPLLKNGMVLKTTQGGNLTITIQDSNVYVNSAKIISSDYLNVNGVIHVIDG
jgi:uncharacterized surface protein with fasciclin (FAS1) repeats